MIYKMEMVLQVLIAIAIPVITTILTTLARKALEYQIQKIEDEKTRRLLLEGTSLILDSVNYVQQTYVDNLKSAGKFDAAAQQHALEAAKTRALDLMQDDVYKVLNNQYKNINNYMDTIIESAIAKKKEKSL